MTDQEYLPWRDRDHNGKKCFRCENYLKKMNELIAIECNTTAANVHAMANKKQTLMAGCCVGDCEMCKRILNNG